MFLLACVLIALKATNLLLLSWPVALIPTYIWAFFKLFGMGFKAWVLNFIKDNPQYILNKKFRAKK